MVSEKLLTRYKVLYGVPNVYQLTRRSKLLISANQRPDKIRLDQIMHDITVMDIAIAFIKALGLDPTDIRTEKQLHQEAGFGTRMHHPDFVFMKNGKKYCVEVELSLKSKARLEKNIKSNFLTYDIQIWITGESGAKLVRILEGFKTSYPNIEITNVREVQDDKFRLNN